MTRLAGAKLSLKEEERGFAIESPAMECPATPAGTSLARLGGTGRLPPHCWLDRRPDRRRQHVERLVVVGVIHRKVVVRTVRTALMSTSLNNQRRAGGALLDHRGG